MVSLESQYQHDAQASESLNSDNTQKPNTPAVEPLARASGLYLQPTQVFGTTISVIGVLTRSTSG